MTCIVAMKDTDGSVIMAGDTMATAGYNKTYRKDQKVFRLGEMLIGFTSSYRMGQLLRYSLKLPKHSKKMSTTEYMHTVFIEEVRETLAVGGYSHVESNIERGGTFLVAYRSRIFKVSDDFQVAEAIDNYESCGCGEDFAKAAFFTLKNVSVPPRLACTSALGAATYFSAAVGGTFTIKRTKPRILKSQK